jgi:hypothetical protein
MCSKSISRLLFSEIELTPRDHEPYNFVLEGCSIYYSITMDNELLLYDCNQRSKLYRIAWLLFYVTKKVFPKFPYSLPLSDIEGQTFFSFFKTTFFANLSRMKFQFLLDQNFYEWRTLKVPEIVSFEAVDLAADSVSPFSHQVDAFFQNFLPFCRELKIT